MDGKTERDALLAKEMRSVNGQAYDDVVLEETSGVDINGNGIIGAAHDSDDEKESVRKRLHEKLEIVGSREEPRHRERPNDRSID